jgi:hypothetical protein
VNKGDPERTLRFAVGTLRSVANGAIKRVVDEQELHDGSPRCFRCFAFDLHHHAIADGHRAGGLRFRHPLNDWVALFVGGDCPVGIAPRHPNFHETLPTDTNRFKARVIAKVRDVNAEHIGCFNDERSLRDFNGLTVNGHTHLFGVGRNFPTPQPDCCASQNVGWNFLLQRDFAPKGFDQFVPTYVARHDLHLFPARPCF